MGIDKLAPFRTAKGLSRRIEGSIMRFLSEDTTVLAGYGFDEKGPYLLINDVEKAA